jgi:integrase
MKRKSEPGQELKPAIREMASVLRRHRLNALQVSYVLRKAREEVGVEPYRPAKRLPRNLTDAELEAFFCAVEAEGPSEPLLLYKLLYYTGCRVSEIVNARREQLDLAARCFHAGSPCQLLNTSDIGR